MVNNPIINNAGNSIVWQTLSIVCCVTLIAFVIIIFSPRKKETKNKKKHTNNTSTDKESFNNSKQWWHYYRSNDKEVLEYYDLYFYWKPLKSWVSCEFYILGEKSKYIWFGSDEKNGTGVISFGEKSYLKKIFDTWIEEYSEDGCLSLKNLTGEVPSGVLKFITSDVYVKECYMNGDKIKKTFNYFEKIHGHSGKNNQSSYNSSNGITEEKKKVVLAMKFFGFSKVPTFTEIKASYKKQAMMYHPDRPNGSIVKMQQINEQYDILKKYFEKQ